MVESDFYFCQYIYIYIYFFFFYFLQVLCLNHNKIECIMPKQKSVNKQKPANTSSTLKNGIDLYGSESGLAPVLENLEVLHLG